ncbi:hypothetical protein BS17DRAFT_780883 [Gyrodon lividus]|nr:hypothetical protein BS17DRAFT_780883 [Gyrodon lividus]
MANISQLQPTVIPQVQRSSSEPVEKGADFLALRLLNKRARVRLSPEPFDLSLVPGKACLFAVANSKGWFAAVIRDVGGASVLILSPLADLRSAFALAEAEDDRPYRPQRRVLINGAMPIILVFACDDTMVLLGLADGSILVYASDQLFSSGNDPMHPTHTFTASSSTVLLSIQPNPGDIPELVAVLRDCSTSPGSLAVELLDMQKFMSSGGWMAGKSPSTTPTSISWSPKGKQLSLGLQSGDIVTYSPTATATPKFSIPHPPSANNMSVASIQWLSTSSFHAIYTPPGQLAADIEQLHFHLSLDSKSNSAQDIKFNSPYLPFPGLRPPGAFVVCLRGWDPSKVLLFIGDSTSSDIGVIGSIVDGTGESWHNLSLEEISTPSLPLDQDQNDTIMLGLDVDLTNDSSYRHSTASGEALDLPASPIMYAYASDGTILGWHILNVSRKSYPGMVTGSDGPTCSPSIMSVPSSIMREPSTDMLTTPAISPTASVAATTSVFQPSPSTFGQPSAFGSQSPAFGQPSAFGQSAFSQQPPSSFGKAPSFGQPAPTSTFGSTPFGQAAASAFGSSLSASDAFGAFSSTGPVKFGQSTFASQPGFSQTTPTFGQSSFGQPALGLSSFGQPQTDPSMSGNPSFGTTATTSTSPGGPFAAFASSTQTAFGVAAAANGGSAKPVWAVNDDSSKHDQPELLSGGATNLFTKPTECSTPKTQSPFASRDMGTSTPLAAASSTFASPSPFSATSHFATRDSAVRNDNSRSPSPAPQDGPPPPLSFTSSPVGPTTGAFSNLKMTPSAFVKPASGFFGQVPRDSPFFAPKLPESKPVSAFALAATPTATQPKPSSAAPTFGAPSMPGGAHKNSFDVVIAAPVNSVFAPGAGAFSAFSNNGGGFAAYSSGGNKSFSDLLRAGEESKESSGAGPSVPALVEQGARAFPHLSVSATPVSTPMKEPLKQLPMPPLTTKLNKEKMETPKVKASEGEPTGVKGRVAEPIPVQEPSLESISSSTSSSFVNISAEKGEVIEEDTTIEGGLQDDMESFLSEASSLESEVSEEESEYPSEVVKEQVEKQLEPTEIQLPATSIPTRSASTTPKAEPPKIIICTPHSPQLPSPSGSVPRVSPARELSTTPPGSPVKDSAPVPSPVQVPVPKPSPPVGSPFSLAPRTNSRPMRSSPLASTPLVLDGEPEKSPPLSRSAPPAITAQPAAPKAPFGQWTPPATVEPEEAEAGLSPRPQTPPLLSLISGAGDKPATANIAPTTTPGPTLSPFTLPSSLPPFAPGPGKPTLWATPSKSVEVTPPTARAATAPFNVQPSPFGPKKPMDAAPPTSPIASSISTSSFTAPMSTLSSPPPTTPTPEQGMQAECLFLLHTLAKELESLKLLATTASAKTLELKKTSGIRPQKVDLGDARKWVFGDIKEYGRILVDVQADVNELKLQRVSLRKALRELDSNMLKAGTRKEEIIRFNRAKTDAEFAKMLKIRTLGPEYLETQSQLRRNTRAIRDCVLKLEDHLQTSKKRINELKLGKPSLRAPSLDTVNRTFRNVDIAIDQQKQEVSKLRLRMAKLHISETGTRDKLTGSSSKRPLNVTPNVAATTAAALNAERSAHRLKRILLASRTQPLMNTMATVAPAPTSFQTPQKALVVKTDAEIPEGLCPLPTTPMMNFPSSLPVWTPPPPSDFGCSVPHDISPSRNRAGSKHHQKPIVLKKNASPASPAQTSFEWKPVQPTKPISSLPFAIRPTGSK